MSGFDKVTIDHNTHFQNGNIMALHGEPSTGFHLHQQHHKPHSIELWNFWRWSWGGKGGGGSLPAALFDEEKRPDRRAAPRSIRAVMPFPRQLKKSGLRTVAKGKSASLPGVHTAEQAPTVRIPAVNLTCYPVNRNKFDKFRSTRLNAFGRQRRINLSMKRLHTIKANLLRGRDAKP